MPRAKTSSTSSSAVQPRTASNAKIIDYYYPTGEADAEPTINGSHCVEPASDRSAGAGGAAPLKAVTKAKKQRPLVPACTPSLELAENAAGTIAYATAVEVGEGQASGKHEFVANGHSASALAVKCKQEAGLLPAAVASAAAECPDTKHGVAAAPAGAAATASSCAAQPAVEPPWLTVAGRKKKKSGSSAKTADAHRLPNRLVTDFFPVRRSDRTTAKQQKNAAVEALRQKVEAACEDGLKVVTFPGKGRGVVAEKAFKRGDFVVEYAGDLIDQQQARVREKEYTRDDRGCYMYYFCYKNKHYCVDATDESGRLGRLLNHSKQGNCTTKLIELNGEPRLVIVAARDIEVDEELLYDYGDRSRASLELHPWLKA